MSWTKEHECNTAIRETEDATPSAFNLRAMHHSTSDSPTSPVTTTIDGIHSVVADTGSSSVGGSALTPVVGSSSAMNVDTPEVQLALQAKQCKYLDFYNVLQHKGNSILIPIIINDIRVAGLIDSGSIFSIVTTKFIAQLGDKVNVTKVPSSMGTVQLGHVSFKCPRIGYVKFKVNYNIRTFYHTFEVFDFFSENDNIPILLGLDIYPKMGIRIEGLVAHYDDDESYPVVPSSVNPEEVIDIINEDPYGTPEERKQAIDTLQPVL